VNAVSQLPSSQEKRGDDKLDRVREKLNDFEFIGPMIAENNRRTIEFIKSMIAENNRRTIESIESMIAENSRKTIESVIAEYDRRATENRITP
jgi:hypothetical protein